MKEGQREQKLNCNSLPATEKNIDLLSIYHLTDSQMHTSTHTNGLDMIYVIVPL